MPAKNPHYIFSSAINPKLISSHLKPNPLLSIDSIHQIYRPLQARVHDRIICMRTLAAPATAPRPPSHAASLASSLLRPPEVCIFVLEVMVVTFVSSDSVRW